MTIEVQILTEDAARRLTERIRYTALSVRDGVEKLQRLVAEAQEGQAHIALGYKSWTAYLADVMGDEPLVLARDQRRDVVAWLAGEGMSTRAIAPIVGTSQRTVVNDVHEVSNLAHLDTPEPVADDMAEVEFAALASGATNEQFDAAIASARADGDLSRANVARHLPADIEAADENVKHEYAATITAPQTVTGMDGKTYPRPEPRVRRRPLTDTARDAGWDLRKAVERLQRISGDDRFASNKEQVAAPLRGHLSFAIEVCQGLIDQLNNQPQED